MGGGQWTHQSAGDGKQQLMGQAVSQLLMAGRSYSYGKKHSYLAKARMPIPGSFCALYYSRAQQLL